MPTKQQSITRERSDVAPSQRIATAAAKLWQQMGPSAVTFGSVAGEIPMAKSLVSHHCPSHAALLRSGAEQILSDIHRDIRRACRLLDGFSLELMPPVERASTVVEHLVTTPTNAGAAVLEFASLSLTNGDYGGLFAELMTTLGEAISQGGSGNKHLMMSFVLGELLSHAPKRAGIIPLAGLRERMGWVIVPSSAPERSWLLALQASLDNDLSWSNAPPAKRTFRVTEARKQETDVRARIVAAALDVLADGNVAEMTHRKIATRAKVPLAATTYYFESKHAILEAAYQHIIHMAEHEAQRLTMSNKQNGLDAFRGVIVNMIGFYIDQGRRSTLAHFNLALSACRDDELSEFAIRAHATEIDALLAQAAVAGLGRNFAQTIVSFVSGTVLLHLVGHAGRKTP